MTEIQQKAEQYAKQNSIKLEYSDGEEFDTGPGQIRAYLAGAAEQEPYIKNLQVQYKGYFDLWEIANEEVERLKKENEEFRDTMNWLSAHFTTILNNDGYANMAVAKIEQSLK